MTNIAIRLRSSGWTLLGVLALAPSCTQQLDLGSFETASEAKTDAAPPDAGRPGLAEKDSGPVIQACAAATARELTVELERPLAIMVVERSQSMRQRFGDTSRLETVAAVTLRVLAGRRLPVGLVQFPAPPIFCSSGSCCASAPVPPKADGGRTIDKLLRCAQEGLECWQSNDDAPTAAALNRAGSFLSALTLSPGLRPAVFLVTDGEPGCGTTTRRECDDAVLQAAALAQENIRTYVLAVGREAQASACLQRISEAGDTFNAADGWSSALLSSQLEERLTSAVAATEEGFCRARLRFSPSGTENLHVFVEGVEIPLERPQQNLPSSFALEPGFSTRFRIKGEACEQLKRRPSEVRVFEGCCKLPGDCG